MDKIRTFDLSYKSSLALTIYTYEKKETASRGTKHYETRPCSGCEFQQSAIYRMQKKHRGNKAYNG